MLGGERPRALASRAGCLALLAAFVVAVHAPRDRADFSLDDHDYVAGNPSIRSLGEAVSAFARPFPPHLPEKGLYRPLTNLTYAIDFALWRDDGRGYHATNVAIYVAVVWGVFALAATTGGSTAFGLAAALLFAAHPVHCEAVDSITGRSEMLSLGFALASLLLFVRAARSARSDAGLGLARALPWLAGSALAYALSALAKESGAMLPAVLAAYFLVVGRRAGETTAGWARRCAAFLAPHALVALAYLLARFSALGALAPLQPPRGLRYQIFRVGAVFFHDVRLLVWPSTSHVDFYWEQLFLSPSDALIPFLLGCALLGLALRTFIDAVRREIDRPGQSDARGIALCALAIFLAFWFPVSHVLPIGATMAERLLFAPSLGFCLLVALAARELLHRLVERPPARTRVAAALVAAVTLAGGIRSHQRAVEWRDDLLLWQTEERALPGDPRVLANLAMAFIKRERWAEGRDAITRARESPLRIPGLDAVIDEIERALERAERRAR